MVTGDEKQIFLNNYNYRNQWLGKGACGIQVSMDDNFDREVILYTLWDLEDFTHVQLLKCDPTVKSEVQKEELTKVRKKA